MLSPCWMPVGAGLGNGCPGTGNLAADAAEELWDGAWNSVLELLLGMAQASAEGSVHVICCSPVCVAEFILFPAILSCLFSTRDFVSQVPSLDGSGLLLLRSGVFSVMFTASVLEMKLLF